MGKRNNGNDDPSKENEKEGGGKRRRKTIEGKQKSIDEEGKERQNKGRDK